MIGTASLQSAGGIVAQNPHGVLRLMDVVRDDAAMEMDAALKDVSVKAIRRANVPGASPYGLSRAANGGESNPLYRIVGVFVLMKRLGMGRARAQRIVDWLQEIVDQLWPEDAVDLGKALEDDSALDPEDDHPRFHAALGCVDAKRTLLEVSRRQRAQKATLILALRRRLAEQDR